jgi:hypothetical protein
MILDVTARDNPIVIEEVTDPAELARARASRADFDRNWQWFQAHAAELFDAYRGKSVCVAGQEAFAADRGREAAAAATAAHPEDQGWFVVRVPREKVIRVYAAQG